MDNTQQDKCNGCEEVAKDMTVQFNIRRHHGETGTLESRVQCWRCGNVMIFEQKEIKFS